ncbi:cytochrome b-c1 complex subunit 7-like [Ixodes scapularis]|nr:cytochrome b-c1 complex subunit 7-like [Ixodes scapularis]
MLTVCDHSNVTISRLPLKRTFRGEAVKRRFFFNIQKMSYKQITNSSWGRFLFNQRKYYQFGLLHDDLYKSNDVVIDEAVRRLPKKILDERNFRLLRAVQCSINHSILPKEQWTKMEDDKSYLDTYIAEVEKELAEKKEWYRTH